MSAQRTYSFELVQGGIVVASVDAPTLDEARREIMHYAMVYAQDGPCSIRGSDVAALATQIGAEIVE